MVKPSDINLDRRASVYSMQLTRDQNNDPITAPVLLGSYYVERTDIRDSERMVAAQMNATITTRFRLRYSLKTKQIDAGYILTCEGVTYDIKGVKEIGRRQFLELTAAARSA